VRRAVKACKKTMKNTRSMMIPIIGQIIMIPTTMISREVRGRI